MIALGVCINCLGIGITGWVGDLGKENLSIISFLGITLISVIIYLVYGMGYSNYKDMRTGNNV